MYCCCYCTSLCTASGMTESKLEQVCFQDFWARAFGVNRDRSANPLRRFLNFWFIYPCLPFRVYNLLVFDKFSDAPLHNFSIVIVCNTLITNSHRKYSIKTVFLKMLQNSQESTSAGVSFLNQVTGLKLTLVFSYEFYEFFKNIFFTEHLRTTASILFTLSFSTGYPKNAFPKMFVYLIRKTIELYKAITYSQTQLSGNTTVIFACCLAVDNKIEWHRSATNLTKLLFRVLKIVFL